MMVIIRTDGSLSAGGHIQIEIVPKAGITTCTQSGLGAAIGWIILVGDAPCELLISCMLDIRIFCVVNGDMMIVVDKEVPPTVVTKGDGVQFVVVLIGSNTKLHGIEHEIVYSPS
jgi:hypothetical protein